MVRSRGLLIAGCLAGFLASSLAGADAAERFRFALDAIDRKDWPRAVVALREALQSKPETGEKVRIYGMRFENYLPYYLIGLAFYHQGDCGQALTAFDASLASGAIRGVKRGRLQIYVDICRQQLRLPLASIPRRTPLAPATVLGLGLPQPSARRPSTPNSDPGTPSPVDPLQTPPATVVEARKQVLDKAVREASRALGEGDRKLGSLKGRNRAALAPQLSAVERRLASARFLLEASRQEGDVDSAEQARDEALAAVEVLEELAQSGR